MAKPWGTYQSYKQVDVETAPQGKLVAMLFNGAIQRAEEGKRAMARGDIQTTHEKLVRAQEIIAELRAALDFNAAPVTQDIDRVYEYLGHLLIQANINKEPDPIDEFVEHATALRDTWDEAFRRAESENVAIPTRPNTGSQGASIVNLQG